MEHPQKRRETDFNEGDLPGRRLSDLADFVQARAMEQRVLEVRITASEKRIDAIIPTLATGSDIALVKQSVDYLRKDIEKTAAIVSALIGLIVVAFLGAVAKLVLVNNG